VQPDRLSELFDKTTVRDIIDCVGPNETVTIKIARERGVTVKRQPNITFWQAFVAITWFPVLGALITAFLWSRDQNNVVIRYAAEHLSVTATGIFAAWLVAIWLMIRLFRYVRNS
jgi:hypothetical protein